MIRVNLKVLMAMKDLQSGTVSEKVGISPANFSILKNNKAKAIRFSTLNALCRELGCQPGDILEYISDDEERGTNDEISS